MKVKIEATQEEFNEKRPELLEALSGGQFDIKKAKSNPKTIYDLKEKPSTQMRRSYFNAQNQMMDHFDAKFKQMMGDIKKDIEAILR
jgi:hypothetical protein